MDLLLKILGALALLFVGALALVAFFFWWKWKAIKMAIRSTQATPSKISLVEEENPDWLGKAGIQSDLAEMQARGFVRAGAFAIPEMPGVRLLGLTHAERGIRGCLYEHDVVGNWIDLCATLHEGTELTVSSAPSGKELETRPKTEKVFLSGRPFSELLAEFDRRTQSRPVTVKATGSFQEEFVADYARDMAWRNAQAGISRAEFLRVAEREGKSYSPELLEEAFKETKLAEMRRWERECVATFEKATTMPVSQWREYEGRMVLFREDFHPAAYVDYVADTIELSDEAKARHAQAAKEGLGVRQLLEHIASEAGAQCVRLGEVDEPIRAEIHGVKLPQTA